MKTAKELREKIEGLQKELQKAEDAERYLKSLDLEHQIAIILHDKHCHWNHPDGCGWFYFVKDGKHDWSEHGHQEYLKKATQTINLLQRHGVVSQKAILDIVENLPV